MADGIRVELRVENPSDCPVVDAAERAKQTISTISWSESAGAVVEEFTTDDDAPIEDDRIETVFKNHSHARHRFSRHCNDCVCHTIEQHGSPVENVRAENNGLTVSFYALTAREVSEVVSALREEFGGVRLRRLHRADDSADGPLKGGDLVWVDRKSLTDRQREVLETAHEMGYFSYPRDANATEVAAEIGISPSTFTEHLTAAQAKLLDSIVGE